MTSPERIVYVDGHYCPESQGKVSIFDRGYLFADAIYEVTCVIGGKLVDFRRPYGALSALAEGARHADTDECAGTAGHPSQAGCG
ncbi:branched-subunit amino acid aminotransferase/4-amino-4-deoxychorismate lyase [Agrobacterium larrymoorei]|uniref:Probable branched-chain-amino-acid aminotransferase n=1 Tax=Agrobacterium larrymoorei TaxID=160699 RepID=A0AAJ2ESL3_9HYPH|nr:branched-subunit amino acid aminotransferase/4-amino-4-deoxychorismate lyase [Agrobacterium larrymoorei]